MHDNFRQFPHTTHDTFQQFPSRIATATIAKLT
jgi:hypothetical protein